MRLTSQLRRRVAIAAWIIIVGSLGSIFWNRIVNTNCDGIYPAENLVSRIFIHEYDRFTFAIGSCRGGVGWKYPAGELVYKDTLRPVAIEEVWLLDKITFWFDDWALILLSATTLIILYRKELFQLHYDSMVASGGT